MIITRITRKNRITFAGLILVVLSLSFSTISKADPQKEGFDISCFTDPGDICMIDLNTPIPNWDEVK